MYVTSVSSTVPGDFPDVLGLLTQQGYRVLAVAHRPLHMAWHKAERVRRSYHQLCLVSLVILCCLPSLLSLLLFKEKLCLVFLLSLSEGGKETFY